MLKVSPKIIRKRLSTRKSGEFGNIVEAQEYVLSWKNWWEDHMCKNGAIRIDANRDIQKVTSEILTRSKSLRHLDIKS